MAEFEKFLKENPAGIFVTHDHGKIRTRAFQYLFADGRKFYFCTSNEKDVYKQMQKEAGVAFCTHAPDFSTVLSVYGKAVFVDDAALKTKALDENPGIKGIYKTPDNPVFELFYIDAETVETFDFAGGPQKHRM